MPKFTLKTLLLSITTTSIGFALMAYALKVAHGQERFALLALWFTSGAFVGGGMLVPFKRAFWGAVAGVVVQVMLLSVLPIF